MYMVHMITVCCTCLGVESLELVYMKDEAGAVFQVVQFHDKLITSVNSEVCVLVLNPLP